MKKAFSWLLGTMLLSGIYSCSDNTIGTSIADTKLEIVADSSFTVSGASVRNEKILTRTMTQLLGTIKATNYGELESDFVCQFLPSNAIDTTGITADMIDSIRLIMRTPLGGYTGDSVMPMRVNVYQLSKQLAPPINSTFNPEGYYSDNSLLGSCAYTATIGASPNLVASAIDKGSFRTIVMKLPKQLAVNMFKEYKANPGAFQSAEKFQQLFPGIYAANSYGSGRIMKIDKTFMLVNYRKKSVTSEGNDTIVRDSASYATTAPEVISNNNIKLKVADNITAMVNQGEAIVQSPAGYEVEINFPLEEIIAKYKSDSEYLRVINSLYFTLPVEHLENEYSIAPPQYLLLVKSSEKEKFFAKNSIADNDKTFYAAYDAATKSYVFGNMRNYLISVLDAGYEEIKDASAMTLVPVDVTSETNTNSYYYYSNPTTTVTSMTPAVSKPTIGKLKLDEAKVALVYSKQGNNK